MTRVILLTLVALLGVDVVLLVKAEWVFGWWNLLFFCLPSGLLGLLVMAYSFRRYEKAYAIHLDNEDYIKDDDDDEMVAGLLLMAAGFLLLLPGLISDVLGLVLLSPSIRRHIVKACK